MYIMWKIYIIIFFLINRIFELHLHTVSAYETFLSKEKGSKMHVLS